MTPRERLIATLNHQQPDRIPLDSNFSDRNQCQYIVQATQRTGTSGETNSDL